MQHAARLKSGTMHHTLRVVHCLITHMQAMCLSITDTASLCGTGTHTEVQPKTQYHAKILSGQTILRLLVILR